MMCYPDSTTPSPRRTAVGGQAQASSSECSTWSTCAFEVESTPTECEFACVSGNKTTLSPNAAAISSSVFCLVSLDDNDEISLFVFVPHSGEG